MSYDTFAKKYDQLMRGELVSFSESRVFDILTHLDYYHINTLMVQSDFEKSNSVSQWFVCKVDESTIKAYLREQKSEMRII